jgi:hypothetical protein
VPLQNLVSRFLTKVYALISIFFLRVTYIHLKNKGRQHIFYGYIINVYLLINILLGLVLAYYKVLAPIAIGFMGILFLYSVFITLLPEPVSLKSTIRKSGNN